MVKAEMMHSYIFLHPFDQFRRELVKSKSFIGTCSLRDVADFLNVHNTGYAFVLWFSRSTKNLYMTQLEFDFSTHNRVISSVQIMKPEKGIERSVLSDRLTIERIEWALWKVDIIWQTWTPCEHSVFGDLLRKVSRTIRQDIQSTSINEGDISIPRCALSVQLNQFDRERHKCNAYLDRESDRAEHEQRLLENHQLDAVPGRNCTRNNEFSPRSLQSQCIFFLANYFTNVKLENDPSVIPWMLRDDFERFGRRIGTSDLMKRRGILLQVNEATWPDL